MSKNKKGDYKAALIIPKVHIPLRRLVHHWSHNQQIRKYNTNLNHQLVRRYIS